MGSLFDYWPTHRQIVNSIRTQAETASQAVFLAVHRPMKFLFRAIDQSLPEEIRTEEQLLENFLADDNTADAKLLPIVGNSGVGKSHAVRWLDIRLRRRPDADRRHIIRIPKSASLKTVLELILADLEGPQYEAIRTKVREARELLDPLRARERLRADLRVALKQRADRAQKENDSYTFAHAREEALPALILEENDFYIPQFFTEKSGEPGILQRIINRIMEGKAVDSPQADDEETSSEDVTRLQFQEEDFQLWDGCEGTDFYRKHNTYLAVLKQKPFRQQAARVMNEVLDDAVYQLLQLGDNRLTEMFKDIRRSLLQEGKELILLVEEFVVLTGIQGALLDAIIQPGVDLGKENLCVMRTALAVTEGRIRDVDTVRTRTVYEWKVEDVPQGSPDETMDAITDLMGAYINAARFGQEELEKQFGSNGTAFEIPAFQPPNGLDETETHKLNAFGHCSQGYPLFPFNREMIWQLSQSRLRDSQGRILYNPRDIINYLLHPVLKDYREHFVHKEFPPANFLSWKVAEATVDVRRELQERFGQEAGQYLTLLRFWGGNPKSIDQIPLPKEVYQTFGLTPLEKGAEEKIPEVPNQKEKEATREEKNEAQEKPPENEPEEISVTLSEEEKQVVEWMPKLSDWFQGRDLSHQDANQLRIWLAKSLHSAMDWDRELLRPFEFRQIWVYLPLARGNKIEPENALFTLCDKETLLNPEQGLKVQAEIEALVRIQIYKSSEYAGREMDTVYWGNLMERGLRQASDFCRRRYADMKGDPVPALVQALLLGARVLGIDGAASPRGDKQLLAVFDLGSSPAPTKVEKWDELRQECAGHRAALRKTLLNVIAVRQSGSAGVNGIDAVRVLEALNPVRDTWPIEAEFPEGDPSDHDGKSARRHVGFLKRQATGATVRKRRETLIERRQKIATWLGEDFQKQEFVETLQQTVRMARDGGIYRGDVAPATLLDHIKAFQESAVSKCMEQLMQLEIESTSAKGLLALAQVDESVLAIVEKLMDGFNDFVNATEKHVKTSVNTIGENILKNAEQKLHNTLEQLDHTLDSLEELTSHDRQPMP